MKPFTISTDNERSITSQKKKLKIVVELGIPLSFFSLVAVVYTIQYKLIT
jgi:hypothetical protein